jgi:hypothetical protein
MDPYEEYTEDRCPDCGMTEAECEVMRDVRAGYTPRRPEARWITYTRRLFAEAT